MLKWDEQFDIIKEIAAKKIKDNGEGKFSLTKFDSLLGLSRGKSRKWANGQRPSAEDLATLSKVFNLSPRWLLLGEGEPSFESTSSTKLDRRIRRTLGDVFYDLLLSDEVGDDEEKLALLLGISVSELQQFRNEEKEVKVDFLAKLVLRCRINPNFVISQIGYPFLSEKQFYGPSPSDWMRQRDGDLETIPMIEAKNTHSAKRHPEWFIEDELELTSRVKDIEEPLRLAKAKNSTICQAVIEMLQGRLEVELYREKSEKDDFETHSKTDTDTLEASAFADKCERSMKRT